MARIVLHFSAEPELLRITFSHPLLEEAHEAVRGKTGGAFCRTQTFQWTQAVKGLAVLILNTEAARRENGECFVFEGGEESPASSLDYSISKGSDWTIDVFGRDKRGRPLVRKLFNRSNSNRKRGGPVSISLNMAQWMPLEVEATLKGESIKSAKILRRIAESILGTRPGEGGAAGAPAALSFNGSAWTSSYQEALEAELRAVLGRTDIFYELQYARLLRSIAEDEALLAISGKKSLHLHETGLMLGSAARLGMANSKELQRTLYGKRPIRVALSTGASGAAAIFYRLRQTKSCNLQLDTSYCTGAEIAAKAIAGDFTLAPDALVAGLPPAAILAAHTRKTEYLPFMLLPHSSQHVIGAAAANRTSQLRSGHYLLKCDTPTAPKYLLDYLLRSNIVNSSLISVCHTEPDETLKMMSDADAGTKAVVFFPHQWFNAALNGCRILAAPKPAIGDQMALFVHRKFLADRKKAQYLAVAIRNAWMELLAPGEISAAAAAMTADSNYIDAIARISGLQARLPQLQWAAA